MTEKRRKEKMAYQIPEYLAAYKPTFKQYKESRKRAGIPTARAALHNAKYNLYRAALLRRWNDAGGDIVCEYSASQEWESGDSRIRIVEMSDCHADMDDLKGDCFDPDVNCDINRNRLAREEREFEERVYRDGVHGYCVEYWNGAEWIETHSIFGFVGNDFIGSGHDDDLMKSALDALAECQAIEARAIEAMRPDMYLVAAE